MDLGLFDLATAILVKHFEDQTKSWVDQVSKTRGPMLFRENRAERFELFLVENTIVIYIEFGPYFIHLILNLWVSLSLSISSYIIFYLLGLCLVVIPHFYW